VPRCSIKAITGLRLRLPAIYQASTHSSDNN
jgi:hypothetical protein